MLQLQDAIAQAVSLRAHGTDCNPCSPPTRAARHPTSAYSIHSTANLQHDRRPRTTTPVSRVNSNGESAYIMSEPSESARPTTPPRTVTINTTQASPIPATFHVEDVNSLDPDGEQGGWSRDPSRAPSRVASPKVAEEEDEEEERRGRPRHVRHPSTFFGVLRSDALEEPEVEEKDWFGSSVEGQAEGQDHGITVLVNDTAADGEDSPPSSETIKVDEGEDRHDSTPTLHFGEESGQHAFDIGLPAHDPIEDIAAFSAATPSERPTPAPELETAAEEKEEEARIDFGEETGQSAFDIGLPAHDKIEDLAGFGAAEAEPEPESAGFVQQEAHIDFGEETGQSAFDIGLPAHDQVEDFAGFGAAEAEPEPGQPSQQESTQEQGINFGEETGQGAFDVGLPSHDQVEDFAGFGAATLAVQEQQGGELEFGESAAFDIPAPAAEPTLDFGNAPTDTSALFGGAEGDDDAFGAVAGPENFFAKLPNFDEDGFLSDEDGFLPSEDEAVAPEPEQAAVNPYFPVTEAAPTTNPYAPAPAPKANPYVPQQRNAYDPMSQSMVLPAQQQTGLYDLMSQSMVLPPQPSYFAQTQTTVPPATPSFFNQPTEQTKPEIKSAPSFLKANTSYSSPYDLPTDVVSAAKPVRSRVTSPPFAPGQGMQAFPPPLAAAAAGPPMGVGVQGQPPYVKPPPTTAAPPQALAPPRAASAMAVAGYAPPPTDPYAPPTVPAVRTPAANPYAPQPAGRPNPYAPQSPNVASAHPRSRTVSNASAGAGYAQPPPPLPPKDMRANPYAPPSPRAQRQADPYAPPAPAMGMMSPQSERGVPVPPYSQQRNLSISSQSANAYAGPAVPATAPLQAPGVYAPPAANPYAPASAAAPMKSPYAPPAQPVQNPYQPTDRTATNPYAPPGNGQQAAPAMAQAPAFGSAQLIPPSAAAAPGPTSPYAPPQAAISQLKRSPVAPRAATNPYARPPPAAPLRHSPQMTRVDAVPTPPVQQHPHRMPPSSLPAPIGAEVHPQEAFQPSSYQEPAHQLYAPHVELPAQPQLEHSMEEAIHDMEEYAPQQEVLEGDAFPRASAHEAPESLPAVHNGFEVLEEENALEDLADRTAALAMDDEEGGVPAQEAYAPVVAEEKNGALQDYPQSGFQAMQTGVTGFQHAVDAVAKEEQLPSVIPPPQAMAPPPRPSSANPYVPRAENPYAPRRSVDMQDPHASMKRPSVTSLYASAGAGQYAPQADPRALSTSPNAPLTLAPLSEVGPRPVSPYAPVAAPTEPEEERKLYPPYCRGASPVVNFGFGGKVVTNFQQQVQRYTSDGPVTRYAPGELKVQTLKSILPETHVAELFPGPVFSATNKGSNKTKKKEVTKWMESKIEKIKQEAENEVDDDVKLEIENQAVLWQVVKIILDNDGVIDGKPAALKLIREILTPGAAGDDANSGDAASFTVVADLVNVPRRNSETAPLAAYTVTSGSIDAIRNCLLRGDREAAVRLALTRKLWAHALLIASSVSSESFKSAVKEFVRTELKSCDHPGADSLSVLYEVFAGHGAEAVEELVPASDMLAQTLTGQRSRRESSSFDKLARWKETLGLILSNRTPGDHAAILGLGKLLDQHGWTNAAHTCYLFSGGIANLSGLDAPDVHFVLLGADHKRGDFGQQLDSIVLTEVYELAIALSGVPQPGLPHLQAYKVYRARVLADLGCITDAQKYCETIANYMKQTKGSPYFHPVLINELRQLTERLVAAGDAGDQPGSWLGKKMARPKLDNLWGSLETSFNKFVAGDENGEKKAPKETDDGQSPFTRIAESNPALSRVHSMADMYGNFNRTTSPIGSGSAIASPRASMDQARTSFEQAPYSSSASSAYGYPAYQNANPYAPPTMYEEQTPSTSLYEPSNSVAPNPYGQPDNAGPYSAMANSMYEPSQGVINPYEPQPAHHGQEQSFGMDAAAGAFASSMDAYTPQPGMSSPYAPPNFQQQYQPPAGDDGFDDLGFGNNPTPKAQKPEQQQDQSEEKKDEKREEQKKGWFGWGSSSKAESPAPEPKPVVEEPKKEEPKEEPKSAGGGWFGWKKKEAEVKPGKPIKAKLGEESTFYYDAELKKWVNKKAGADAAAPAPLPPPPKAKPAPHAAPPAPGPPVNTPSIGPPPPSAFASHTQSAGVSPAPGAGGMAPPPSSMPPRPATAAPAGPPKPAAAGGDSLDDLLTRPPPRKSATVGRKAARAKYVDVFAEQK
ncbi:hypothetical protein G7K_5871-t1 [Saitoella complicata NRRL Y-17804]|uniref:Protein transport protein sec16 n=3 Tax=Saitoella complicata (strain BCRC 22490 / CBS 7301 / JCM 7358 / NBRC 10748 / NRRL Y-17804) TaxID=698492 RepID=A0A0E9NPP3_SAICN|nr:hypothetical protein G7K_5871-t1 [Saitoella complicata NRRL Y-17804]